MKSIANENFQKWMEALKTRNPNEVSNLYSGNSTFLPTVSSEFKKGHAGAKEYFEHFLQKNPSGEIIEEEVQSLTDDVYLHSGMYNFEVDGADGRRSVVEARFSFVWERINDKWIIQHHHSSVKPK